MEQEKDLALEQAKRVLRAKQYKELKQLISDYGSNKFSYGLAIGGDYHKALPSYEKDVDLSLTDLLNYLIGITDFTKGE
ncbi:hypothetical protein [Eubacterium limosum]|uniref:hypothetical protein n=1 Tax=Eubacterium limosum TaxID=1736 RepID=UPI0022E0FC8E|nr:hypothetical protein [Eubacterium limosum]